jgi:hypothetical protein
VKNFSKFSSVIIPTMVQRGDRAGAFTTLLAISEPKQGHAILGTVYFVKRNNEKAAA